MSARQDICLRCPRGCEIHTELSSGGEITSMRGNACKLGAEYVRQEIEDPRRILPTSVRVIGGRHPLVPVWTPEPIPKHLLGDLAAFSRTLSVRAPVAVGDVILEDWKNMGIRLVASGAVSAQDAPEETERSKGSSDG